MRCSRLRALDPHGQLVARFPRQLVFKGGFVLRHVHGIVRFSSNVDATRHEPPRHKLEAGDFAEAIRDATIGDIVHVRPAEPATDSTRSLDFDSAQVTGAMIPDIDVQVEVSCREAVVDEPFVALIGSLFYADFEILAMVVSEMAAEKLRALAQRVRATDLADLAEILVQGDARDEDIARLAKVKFQLVQQGAANRVERIEQHLNGMGQPLCKPLLCAASGGYPSDLQPPAGRQHDETAGY
ncbi:MAG: nucleotidyl transferase AbiEii/AbiGii toxin family protein [Acidimicrobiales bacterium]